MQIWIIADDNAITELEKPCQKDSLNLKHKDLSNTMSEPKKSFHYAIIVCGQCSLIGQEVSLQAQ